MRHPFEYQAPTREHIRAIQVARDGMKVAFESLANAGVPECAEETLAIRKLEEASMWANKAIVFDGEPYL